MSPYIATGIPANQCYYGLNQKLFKTNVIIEVKVQNVCMRFSVLLVLSYQNACYRSENAENRTLF